MAEVRLPVSPCFFSTGAAVSAARRASAPHPNPLPESGERGRAAPSSAHQLLAGSSTRPRRVGRIDPRIRHPLRPPHRHPRAAAVPSGARGTRAPIRVTVGQLEERAARPAYPRASSCPIRARRYGSSCRTWRRLRAACRASPSTARRSATRSPAGSRPRSARSRRASPARARCGSFPPSSARSSRAAAGTGAAARAPRAASTTGSPRSPARPEAEATRVDVVIGYALTGPLAQIGRAGLVRDLVRRIGEAFAQNLDARLRDPTSAMPQARLGGLSLLLQVLADRVRALLARLAGRRG